LKVGADYDPCRQVIARCADRDRGALTPARDSLRAPGFDGFTTNLACSSPVVTRGRASGHVRGPTHPTRNVHAAVQRLQERDRRAEPVRTNRAQETGPWRWGTGSGPFLRAPRMGLGVRCAKVPTSPSSRPPDGVLAILRSPRPGAPSFSHDSDLPGRGGVRLDAKYGGSPVVVAGTAPAGAVLGSGGSPGRPCGPTLSCSRLRRACVPGERGDVTLGRFRGGGRPRSAAR